MKKILVLFFLALLSACGTLGDKFDKPVTPGEDEAVVYFYRPAKRVGYMYRYSVMEGDKPIVRLNNRGYYPYITKAGKTTFSSRKNSDSIVELDIEKGKTYFIRGEMVESWLVLVPEIKQVDAAVGLKEIKDCKLNPVR